MSMELDPIRSDIDAGRLPETGLSGRFPATALIIRDFERFLEKQGLPAEQLLNLS